MSAAIFLWTAAAAHAATAGPISIEADITGAARRLHHAHLILPVEPGPLTLVYPKWIPGEHAPTGPIGDVVNLKISAGGRELPWRRDARDMFEINCDAPPGVGQLEISFDFITGAPDSEGFSSAASTTPNLAMVSWSQLVFYPKGARASEVQIRPSLVLPEGWKFGTALVTESAAGPKATFAQVTLERLVDSPVLCGKYFREVPIGPAGPPSHFLEIAADSPEALEIAPETQASLDRLVIEAGKLFGARPYGSYKFLISLSDHIAHFGLEHHECSDDRLGERAFIDPTERLRAVSLLPHEYTHSWNGKYRRPAGLATPDYETPMDGELLWVYEGLTEYVGTILTARSGLWTPEQVRAHWAVKAQFAKDQRGREWRPLVDTTIAAQVLYEARAGWSATRRGVDFYDEGALIWLEADTLIREQTKGRRSLDDFCRRFHGGQNGLPAVKPYTMDEIVLTLNDVAPYDWRGFLAQRIEAAPTPAPLGGLERGGWKLSYAEKPTELQSAYESGSNTVDLAASIGLFLSEKGDVIDVVPGSAAARAGLAPDMSVKAVNSRRFSPEVINAAVVASKTPGAPLELLVENTEFYRTYALDYSGGQKYPVLERDKSKRDWLDEIHKPLDAKPREKTRAK
jgi:predicted metalloprotease with PDZ domain